MSVRVTSQKHTQGTLIEKISCTYGFYSHITMELYYIFIFYRVVKAFKTNNQISLYMGVWVKQGNLTITYTRHFE